MIAMAGRIEPSQLINAQEIANIDFLSTLPK